MPYRWLEIELTEGTAVTDIPSAASQLQELIDAGIGVALDDHGTGNSSLATIRKLPLTRVKIDISLIQDIDTDPFAAAIVGRIHPCMRVTRAWHHSGRSRARKAARNPKGPPLRKPRDT